MDVKLGVLFKIDFIERIYLKLGKLMLHLKGILKALYDSSWTCTLLIWNSYEIGNELFWGLKSHKGTQSKVLII
jgi:hypothetical protein